MADKEPYFTPRTLESQALGLYRQVRRFSRDRRIVFRPRDAALLVLDMQGYFLVPASHAFIPSAPAIVHGISRLVDIFFSRARPVIFTQHSNTPADAGMMSVWWKDLLTPQGEYYRVIPVFDLTRGQLIQKCQYDAFYQTDLEPVLHKEGIKQLVICGVMTHLCCETTARSAFMRGFEVFFPVDGTATYNLELHQASLLNLAHGFATVVLLDDIIEALRGEHGR